MDDSLSASSHEQHSYFIPMVDMLAGVVFILVILLASIALVSRDSFPKTAEAQAELARIERSLEEARAMERDLLEPRRNAEAAARRLLERLQARLAAEGIASEARPREMKLVVPGAGNAGGSPSAGAGRLAAALSAGMAAELPCLVGDAAPPAGCSAYPPTRLDRVTLAVRGAAGSGDASASEARALSLLSRVADTAPGLLGLVGPDGDGLLRYRGFEPAPPPPATRAGEVGTAAGGVAGGEGSVEILLQFDLPPLPPA